jgi:hypothetical protein
MGFKQALFLGGAVVVLAACGDATAPDSLVRDGAAASAAKFVVPTTISTPTTTTTTPLPPLPTLPGGLLDECRGNFVVPSGRIGEEPLSSPICVIDQ